MSLSVTNVAFDCTDTALVSRFWCEALGLDPEALGAEHGEAWLDVPGGPTLYFNPVPEPKTVKNRLHLCLRPDADREAEVERLLALGATVVADLRRPGGLGWMVLADPEGNEFCVLRPAGVG